MKNVSNAVFTEDNMELLQAVLKRNEEKEGLENDIDVAKRKVCDVNREIFENVISNDLKQIAVFFNGAAKVGVNCGMRWPLPSDDSYKGIAAYADEHTFELYVYITDNSGRDSEIVFCRLDGDEFLFLEQSRLKDELGYNISILYNFVENWENIKQQMVSGILSRLEAHNAKLAKEIDEKSNTLNQLRGEETTAEELYERLKKNTVA